jgi:prepilin-type N-terminal cleavage/methylation domain-containing protein
MDQSKHRAGFTILELMISLSIIAVLASMMALSWDDFKGRAEKNTCVAQMRSIFVALEGYLNDHDEIWPQIKLGSNKDAYWEAWHNTLEPYGIYHDVWLCPTHKRLSRSVPGHQEEDEPEFDSSYGITPFDSRPFTPYRWTQPWLIEDNDYHEYGNHVMMPDGSIQHITSASITSLGN